MSAILRPSGPLAIVLVFSWAVPGEAAAPPRARLPVLSPAQRSRLDRQVLRLPPAAPAQDGRDLAGNVPAWLLRQVSLSPEEERTLAEALHKEVLARHRSLEGRDIVVARRLLARLVAQLPAHLKPAGVRYTLTVLDQPDNNAFAIGGGWAYLSQPLLSALLSDRERGESALAFILAVEVAHTALGHCRRGWQRLAVEEEARKGIKLGITPAQKQAALGTGVRTAGKWVEFLYSRDQQFEADYFAFQLCASAGVPLDGALEVLRRRALTPQPSALADPPPLWRLKRLLMERDGLMEDVEHGLFVYDRACGTLKRCGARSVRAGDRPILFVHGLRGGKESFAPYLAHFGEAPELRGRKLLVFRYPGNGSLARSGLFLANEMRRVVTAPDEAVFVCHSAGGLVFRHYAERTGGGFSRAIFLGTSHRGSNLTSLKFLVDVAEFAGDLTGGLTQAIALTVPEGRGEITLDLHPDSLFLRHLGQNDRLAARYEIYYGHYFTPWRALALQAAFAASKRLLATKWVATIESPTLKRQALRWLAELRLPEEVLRGDLIVSIRSAGLRGVKRSTKTGLHHQALKTDEALMKLVLASITER